MNSQHPDLFEKVLVKLTDADESFALLHQIIRETPENSFFISGGIVRDILMGGHNRIKDIDIFLTSAGLAKIEPFLKANGKVHTNQFGTKRWFPGNAKELYYDIIEISRFRNGLWPCRDMNDVLNQFDITANSVAFDLASGKFYNPQNGLDDINNRVLRAVRFDYPEMLVSDDIPISRNSVLWFRYHFYASKLGFEIEPITKKWIDDNSFRSEDLEKFKKYFFDPYKVL